MQRLAADLVGEHVRATAVEQDQVELLRAVAFPDAGPQRRVRVHPLGRRGARQQLQHHLEVLPLRQHLLDPHHGHERLRHRQAHAPVALGLDDHHGPGLGDAEVRARHGDRHRQELRAQVAARRLGDRDRLVAELLARDRALEQPPDLGAVEVDRRHEDVRLLVAGELHDQLGQVGLDRGDALRGERLVEPDLVGRQRLDLDHLVAAVGAGDLRDDRVRLGAVARPVHGPARARDRLLEPRELLRQRRHRARLDRGAGVAQLLPVGQLGDRPRALRADRRDRLADVAAQLRVAQRLAAPPPGSRGFIPGPPGSRRGASSARRRAGA